MSRLRALTASVWMGWQRDLGWTNAAGGLAVKTVAPIGSVMTVALIYWLGATVAGTFDAERMAFVLVGAAMYSHVAVYSSVQPMAISEGKWTNVFTHVYISPGSALPYLAGRCLASFCTSAVTSLVSLLVAYAFVADVLATHVQVAFTPASALMLAVAMVLNIPGTMGLGFLLGGYTIFASKFEWALPSYVSGLLMIFSGALFPVTMLPWPLSSAAEFLPFTQFIAAARDALVYGSLSAYLPHLAYALAGGVLLFALGAAAYRAAEGRGRRLGFIDRKSV